MRLTQGASPSASPRATGREASASCVSSFAAGMTFLRLFDLHYSIYQQNSTACSALHSLQSLISYKHGKGAIESWAWLTFKGGSSVLK